MKKKYSVKIICVIISAIASIIVSFASGTKYGIKKQDNYVQSQIISVDGNGNTVLINDVTTLISEYNKLAAENETLKQQNTQYFNDYTEQKDTNSELENKLNENPDFSFSSIGLCIDGNQIPIEDKDSIVDINGRQYWSKEIVTSILPDTQTANIKDNTLYIGQMIEDPHNLFDQFINNSNYFIYESSAKDSFGNSHSNCGVGNSLNGYVTFVLNKKYSKLKIGGAINSEYPCDASFQIKADDVVVYSSDTITVQTEPSIVDNIDINNCNLLTIEYSSERSWGLILYDAVLYN